MKLCRADEALTRGAALLARESRVGGTLGGLVFAAIFAGIPVVWYVFEAPAVVWVLTGLVSLAVVPMALTPIPRLWSADNWVLAFDGRSVWLNLRSPYNPGPRDACHVLRLDRGNIASIHPDTLTYTLPRANGKRDRHRSVALKVHLTAPPPDDVLDALATELTRRTTRRFLGVTTHSRRVHNPVSFDDDGTLRIPWRGGQNGHAVTPPIDDALRILSRSLPIGEPAQQDLGVVSPESVTA